MNPATKLRCKILESDSNGCIVVESCERRARIRVNKVRVLAHRLAWELFFGKIPDGLCVCHHCDNPKCVNPDHLFLGTIEDNNNDRESKNRTARGKQLPQTVIPAHTIRALRDFRKMGITERLLSQRFGISSGWTHRLLVDKSVRIDAL